MKISIYKGLDEELFCNIGKYAMDASIIKKLGNPITTDKDCVWVVSSLGSSICGFCRLKISSTKNLISNVCINPDGVSAFEKIVEKIFNQLLTSALENANKNLSVISYADKDTLPFFEKNLFTINKKGLNWHTVIREKI